MKVKTRRGWSAEPKPNPEPTTNPHISTKTTELGHSPESNNLIDDPPAPGLAAGGVVHEVITTGIPNTTDDPPQPQGKVTSGSGSEDSGPGYENLPTLERPSPRPRASSEPNVSPLMNKEIIKYAYAEHMAAVPHELPTSAASTASPISAPAIDSNITSEFEDRYYRYTLGRRTAQAPPPAMIALSLGPARLIALGPVRGSQSVFALLLGPERSIALGLLRGSQCAIEPLLGPAKSAIQIGHFLRPIDDCQKDQLSLHIGSVHGAGVLGPLLDGGRKDFFKLWSSPVRVLPEWTRILFPLGIPACHVCDELDVWPRQDPISTRRACSP
eukprot:g8371.t1